jgi:hypothetical protein
MLMDGQTDMTKFIVAFWNFANVHENCLGYHAVLLECQLTHTCLVSIFCIHNLQDYQ